MSQTNSAAPAAAQAAPAATAQEAHELLREVVQGRRLSREQASAVFAALGAGELSEVETAALLAALLPVERLVAPDLEAGVIDQLAVRGVSPVTIAAAKTGTPIAVGTDIDEPSARIANEIA